MVIIVLPFICPFFNIFQYRPHSADQYTHACFRGLKPIYGLIIGKFDFYKTKFVINQVVMDENYCF